LKQKTITDNKVIQHIKELSHSGYSVLYIKNNDIYNKPQNSEYAFGKII